MTDVSNRRREPKGIPTGGRFADEPGGSMDASDLNEPDMTPTPTITAHGHYRTIAYPGTPSATFGPYARQEGWDKAYMKAMESPHRPDDVKMLTVTGGRPYAIHDGDGVSVSVSLTKTEHVGPVFRHIGGFLEAAGRMRAENPHVIDITLRDEELSITMDDGNTLSVYPANGEAVYGPIDGDALYHTVLVSDMDTAERKPGDDYGLDAMAQGLSDDFYTMVGHSTAIAKTKWRTIRRHQLKHADPTPMPGGFTASDDGNIVGSRTARVRVQRSRLSAASDDDMRAAATAAARLDRPVDIHGSQVTTRQADGTWIRVDEMADYAATWRTDEHGNTVGLEETDARTILDRNPTLSQVAQAASRLAY